MAADHYDDILRRAQTELTPEQQIRLSEVLSQLAGRKNCGTHQITELRGLGAEACKGVDPDVHVAEERDSWGG